LRTRPIFLQKNSLSPFTSSEKFAIILFRERKKGGAKMQKLELLSHIQALSSLLSSDVTAKYISEGSKSEMKKALDEMTENYVSAYCAR
jgi:hypothetical protein